MNKNETNTPTEVAPSEEETVVVSRPEAVLARRSETTLLVGLDLGTNKSCIQTSQLGQEKTESNHLIPTVVGHAKDGILEGILPGNALRFYGREALDHRLHLRLAAPLQDGVIADPHNAKDYLRHLRALIGHEASEVRVVVGLPANADAAARETLLQVAGEVFDRIIAIPEPFLAALGMRDESRLNDPDYSDPVRNSLFIDIGAGTTDLCLVQGCYPGPDDQISLRFGGDKVDQLLDDAIRRVYPDCELSLATVRELKERLAFVGEPEGEVSAKVIIGGRSQSLDLAGPVRKACDELLNRVFDALQRLIARTSPESVGELLQNIVLTGGGSRIRNLAAELQRRLFDEGFENPRVTLAGEDDAEFVARGALKTARRAREAQWMQTSPKPAITYQPSEKTAPSPDTTVRRRAAKHDPELAPASEPVPAPEDELVAAH